MIIKPILVPFFAATLVGCAAPERYDIEPSETPSLTPGSSQTAADDLPPCPGINPDIRRPAGSNCLGITLDQCGADKAQKYVGRQGTAVVRAELEKLAVDGFRWIPVGTAVIQDLRPDRFNVELDSEGIVAKVDCY